MDVPESKKPFPVFKAGNVDPTTHKVKTWWLWDGKKEWRVGKLTKEQKGYPLREIWNDILLVDRVGSEWRSRDAV